MFITRNSCLGKCCSNFCFLFWWYLRDAFGHCIRKLNFFANRCRQLNSVLAIQYFLMLYPILWYNDFLTICCDFGLQEWFSPVLSIIYDGSTKGRSKSPFSWWRHKTTVPNTNSNSNSDGDSNSNSIISVKKEPTEENLNNKVMLGWRYPTWMSVFSFL